MSKQDTWFKARFNWSEIFDVLNDSQLRTLILTIWHYAKNGSEPESLPAELKLAWRLIKGELENDVLSREYGKKGGNPKLKPANPSTGVEPGLNGGSIEKNRIEEKREEKKYKKNIPPTLEEVRSYCVERKNNIDPEQFIDFYQARGWELKQGQKIKDWKACIRTWERNQKERPAENRIEGGGNNVGFNAGRI